MFFINIQVLVILIEINISCPRARASIVYQLNFAFDAYSGEFIYLYGK